MLGHYCARASLCLHIIMSIVQTVFAIHVDICGVMYVGLFSHFLFWPFHLRLLEGNVKVLQFPPGTYLHCVMVQVQWLGKGLEPC